MDISSSTAALANLDGTPAGRDRDQGASVTALDTQTPQRAC
ncbi:MAG: hypothetical protein R2713_13775 [Ilumatobacteraceae bacterium]